MIRYALFVAAVLGSAATAIAAIQTGDVDLSHADQNVTVFEKNQAWPVLGELEVDECQIEDCSEE